MSASVCATVTTHVKGLPRQAVGSLAILPCQPDGLLSDRYPSGCKWLCDDIVQSLMSGDSARHPFANKGMRATGINLSATNARMWNANVAPQPQTQCHANGTDSTSRRRPLEAMGRAWSQSPLCGAAASGKLACCSQVTSPYSNVVLIALTVRPVLERLFVHDIGGGEWCPKRFRPSLTDVLKNNNNYSYYYYYHTTPGRLPLGLLLGFHHLYLENTC